MGRLSLWLLMPLMAGCTSPAALTSVTEAIINGVGDSGDPSVVMLAAQVPGANMIHICTGEVVSPHVVLTAAHCTMPSLVGDGAKFVVFTGAVLTSTTSSQLSLDVAETHYDPAFDLTQLSAGHDVAVVILRSPTTLTPLPLNRLPLSSSDVGHAVRLVGYGITSGSDSSGASAGSRRQAPTLLNHFDDHLVSFGDQTHSNCNGDSGGPALMTIDGVERIIGVTSFGEEGCPTSGLSFDTRVDAYADFVDGYIQALDPPPASAGHVCTSDSECGTLPCGSTSAGKLCTQRCDPTNKGSCPADSHCASIDGETLCAPGAPSHGCSLAASPPEGAALPPLGLLLLALALRRRRLAQRA